MDKATNDGATPLLMAAQNGHTEIVDVLLKHDAEPDQPMVCLVIKSPPSFYNPCHNPCHLNSIHVSPIIHIPPRSSPTRACIYTHFQNGGVTPLMCAAFGGHGECITLLLAAGADRHTTMTAHNGVFNAGPGTTALDLATQHGHGEAAALLTLELTQ